MGLEFELPVYDWLMKKDFDEWNNLKKVLDQKTRNPHVYPLEVWWCSIGINIGAEIDGKNENFERPVLILKVYNSRTMLVLPITAKEKSDKFHCRISGKQGDVWVKLTQIRVIGAERLIRRVDKISEEEFASVRKALQEFL